MRQTQSDTVSADTSWPRTPGFFHAPVTVLVGTAHGEVRRRAILDAREQSIVIDSLPGAPTMVVFDEGNTIVKSLDFPQPTEWLATQLARDPDLWNRWWAISQLARRATDPDAAKALATAATGADYFLTREHAATALAFFPRAVALPALDVARHDSSAQVRAAAITALARTGGAESLAALCEAMNDSSYGVQAAAIGALILTDSADRASWIARGLGASSYRDVVRNAALDALARVGDASYIARIDSLRGESARASNTLAIMSVRGDTTALGVLVHELNDPRAYVRDWSLALDLRLLAATPAQLFNVGATR